MWLLPVNEDEWVLRREFIHVILASNDANVDE